MDLVSSAGAAEMNATSGTQFGRNTEAEVDQSGTAGFTLYGGDVTNTGNGSGDQKLVDLKTDTVTKFEVDQAGWLQTAQAVTPGANIAAAPTEPFACDATHPGAMQYVDDTNDTAWSKVCVCANLDGTGYDWRDLGDITGTACPFF